MLNPTATLLPILISTTRPPKMLTTGADWAFDIEGRIEVALGFIDLKINRDAFPLPLALLLGIPEGRLGGDPRVVLENRRRMGLRIEQGTCVIRPCATRSRSVTRRLSIADALSSASRSCASAGGARRLRNCVPGCSRGLLIRVISSRRRSSSARRSRAWRIWSSSPSERCALMTWWRRH
ncbi:MAG: hypothetical protein IPN05_00010 [Sulfuritalea sp.]|nr:hypothetical protein [Sulfuritalea sp.]